MDADLGAGRTEAFFVDRNAMQAAARDFRPDREGRMKAYASLGSDAYSSFRHVRYALVSD